MIEFTVYGIPVPQGSSRAFIPKGWNRPVITAANSKTKPWRQEIAGSCPEMAPIAGAVRLEMRFFFPRPKSLKKSVLEKITKPDADKLARSVLDSLTGIAYRDDSQVTEMHVLKAFGEPARAEIRIESVRD